MTDKQTKDLYTTKDVKEVRELLLKAQKQIDPVLYTVIPVGDACLDHNHITQECRGVLDRQTNAFEGLVFNAFKRCLSWKTEESLSTILRRLADYLESTPLVLAHHPHWIKKVKTEFNKLPEGHKKSVLLSFGSEEGRNAKERKDLFAKIVLNREHGYEKIIKIIKGA